MAKKASKPVLGFAQVKENDDIEYDEIDIWGGTLRIGSLDAASILEFTEDNEDPAKKKIAGINLIARSVVDENGQRWGCQKAEDGQYVVLPEAIKLFKAKDHRSLQTVVERVMKLNGLKTKAEREAAKNASGEVTTADSPTV